jgi:hypothetical protein
MAENAAVWASLAAKQNLSAVVTAAAVDQLAAKGLLAAEQEEGRVNNNGKQQIAYI